MGPVAALLFNAAVWGLSWWPLRELQAAGLHPVWTTALVLLACTLGLSFWARADLAVWSTHPLLWLLALVAGLTNVGFNWAVTTGDVVRVVLLFYLMPLWSVLLAWWLLGERPGAGHALRMALALGGVVLVLKQPDSHWPLPRSLPDVLGVLSGMSFALTNILLLKLAQVRPSARMLAMFGGGGAMALALAVGGGTLLSIGPVPGVNPASVGWLAVLALGFLAGNFAMQYGTARLAASVTALVMLMEIVFASLSSVALGAAKLDARTLIGGALIAAAALLAALPSKDS